MADLEDLFLKKNVPGRYSSWADENDDRRGIVGGDNHGGDGGSGDDSEDDEYYFEGLPTPAASQAAMSTHPSLRPSGGNTGVKGVLADYREAQQEEQLLREEERLDKLRAFDRATRPAVRSECAPNNKNAKNDDNISNDDSDDDDDLDDSDDEFLKQFRSQRLAELQNKSSSSAKTGANATTLNLLPTYGLLISTTPEEYVDMVDKLDSRSFLLVHLYESSIQQSRMLHSALEKVAACMEHTIFIEVNAMEANPNLDTICLPAILVYRGGKLIHNLVRFTEDLSENGIFGMEEVRDVLQGLLGTM